MLRSSKVSRTFEFLHFFGAAEIIQAKFKSCWEKSKKVEAGFSAEFFGSQ